MFMILLATILLTTSATSSLCPTSHINDLTYSLEYDVTCNDKDTIYNYYWKDSTAALTVIKIQYTCFNGSHYSEAEIGLHKDIYSAEEPIAPNGTIRVFKPFSVPVDNFYCNFSACVCVNENKWYSSATNSQSCINNEVMSSPVVQMPTEPSKSLAEATISSEVAFQTLLHVYGSGLTSLSTATRNLYQSQKAHITENMTSMNKPTGVIESPQVSVQTQTNESIPIFVVIGIMLLLIGSISITALFISKRRFTNREKSINIKSSEELQDQLEDTYSLNLYTLNDLSGSLVTVLQSLEPVSSSSNVSTASSMESSIGIFDFDKTAEICEVEKVDDSESVNTIQVEIQQLKHDVGTTHKSDHYSQNALLTNNDVANLKTNDFNETSRDEVSIFLTKGNTHYDVTNATMHEQFRPSITSTSDGYIETTNELLLDTRVLKEEKVMMYGASNDYIRYVTKNNHGQDETQNINNDGYIEDQYHVSDISWSPHSMEYTTSTCSTSLSSNSDYIANDIVHV